MIGFRNYLFSKGIANEKSVKYYKMWVSKYLYFHESSYEKSQELDDIDKFISMLSKKYADWQLNQANEAGRAYFLFQALKTALPSPLHRLDGFTLNAGGGGDDPHASTQTALPSNRENLPVLAETRYGTNYYNIRNMEI